MVSRFELLAIRPRVGLGRQVGLLAVGFPHIGVLAFSNRRFDGGAHETGPLALHGWCYVAAKHHAITLRKASWNRFISSGRPMVRRM